MMNNEKVQIALDLAKATFMLLFVCATIILSTEILFDIDIFSIKRVIALAVLIESAYSLQTVV